MGASGVCVGRNRCLNFVFFLLFLLLCGRGVGAGEAVFELRAVYCVLFSCCVCVCFAWFVVFIIIIIHRFECIAIYVCCIFQKKIINSAYCITRIRSFFFLFFFHTLCTVLYYCI